MNIGPRLRPRVSFLPTIMEALSRPQADPAAKAFAAALGAPLVKELQERWKRLPGAELNRRFYLSRTMRPPAGDLATQLSALSRAWQASREQLMAARKRVIKTEVDRALTAGLGAYTPGPAIQADKTLAYEVWRRLYGKLVGCRCEEAGESPPPAAPARKYGLKVTRLKCHDQREAGHDEIYLVGTAVDGKGQLITSISPKYSIDDDDDDVLYPNYWVYPMQDPAGFLDVSLAMWEDDGGYADAAAKVSAIGKAIASLPSPYTVAAGVAITIIGEILGLASALDEDDHYGDASRSWPTATNLEAGVGAYVLGYYEVDSGWFDDGHDFDVTLNLLSA
ncbi:MAG: hypothetical protein SF070_08030 [Gemmatimonadota bacterium]|nr:hypothetical protein [Gemmatimonadota bacterium]